MHREREIDPMPCDDSYDVTHLLKAHRRGDRDAFGRLMPLLYDELRRIARRHLRRANPHMTLDATSLVHEYYLKMADESPAKWEGRDHFLAIAARSMRQILIGHLRRRSALKRGGDRDRLTLDEGRVSVQAQAEWMMALDHALSSLGTRSERLVRVVECRFFAGLSEEETASALGVSLRTVQRDWMRARAWLQEELRSST